MADFIEVAGLRVAVLRKDIKNLHLSVYPPTGAVRISAPRAVDLETVRLFALTKLEWIRQSRQALIEQAREPERDYVERESHFVWGKRVLLHIVEAEAVPRASIEHSRLVLQVRPGTSQDTRRSVLSTWYRAQVREQAEPLIERWSTDLGVSVSHLYVRQMKTKWGTCNPAKGTIRLNTELAKKPIECLEYVVVHELAHLLNPSHDKTFVEILDWHLPGWRGSRDRLNQAPLGHAGFLDGPDGLVAERESGKQA